MKTIGIIAEYNPFHQGHSYLIDQAKKATGAENIVVVMSGNTVQRGDFALVDSFTRAETAIKNGVDLVLELSSCYSSQSAEYFAKGATSILNSLGVVDYLCYGSEHNDIRSQIEIARFLNEKEEEILILSRDLMKTGINYPKAREQAVRFLGPKNLNYDIMMSPNDILAIEYIKALDRLGSSIKPISIKRKGADHNDTDFEQGMPSASAIRNMVLNKSSLFYHNINSMACNMSDMEEELILLRKMELRTLESMIPSDLARYILEKREAGYLGSIDNYMDEIKGLLISRRDRLEDIFEVKEGIENALAKGIHLSETAHDLAMYGKSKRFPYTRLRRILMNVLLGYKKEDMELVKLSSKTPYSRILAFNDKGRVLLKRSKDNEQISLINKVTDFRPEGRLHRIQTRYDNIADELFYLKYQYYQRGKRIYTRNSSSPIYIK